MSPSRDETSRERDLQAIRDTYQGYREAGRHRLWDLENPGFRRLIQDRDARLVELLRASVPLDGTARVLDLGSGDGRLAQVAINAGLPIARWVGVDLDPGAAGDAAAAHPWATFLVASADALPFEDADFDAVVCSTLFSSLPSPTMERAVAREIKRVLRREAWLIWYDLRYSNPVNRAVHGIDSGRLAALFPGWRAEVEAMTLLPPLARRLGRFTALLYGFLEHLPLLRSHLVGRVQRPENRSGGTEPRT